MKILHIIDSLGLGGAQTVVKGVFEYQKTNRNIFLLALRKKNVKISIDHQNIKVVDSNKKYSSKPLFEMRNFVQKEKIDVLHCHLFRSQIFGWILKKLWFKDIKLVFHEHGKIFQKHFLYNFFVKRSQNLVDLFVAVSMVTKEELVKINILKSKIIILYNFVDLNKFSRENINWDIKIEKEKLQIFKNEFVIGFVGRLVKVKGCEYLIRALPYLNFPFKVLIVGDGPERQNLEKLVQKLNVGERVIFLGYRSDTLFVYSLMDVLVVPSIFESFGLSVLEVQALHIPVIASRVGGVPELVKDRSTGLLFEPKKYSTLKDKLILTYCDKNLKNTMVKDAFLFVKKYDLPEYIFNLNKIYERVKKIVD